MDYTELSVCLYPNVYTEGSIVAIGNSMSDNAGLLRKIASQLSFKGFEVDLFSSTPMDGISTNFSEHVGESEKLYEKLSELVEKVDTRLTMMKEYHVDSIYKLDFPLDDIGLLINDFDLYMKHFEDKDAKEYIQAKKNLHYLMDEGLKCGILLVLSMSKNTTNNSYSVVRRSTQTRIIVGKCCKTLYEGMFDDDLSNISIPNNCGICQINGSRQYVVFNIDDMKDTCR